MKLYIVRHGETDRNTERKLSGRAEVPLNDRGIKQAEQTGDSLKDIVFSRVISSPSGRAVQTAEIIIAGRDIPIQKDERLHEIDWGDWDGHPNAGDSEEMIREMQMFYNDSLQFHGAPHGETLRSVRERGRAFYRDFLMNEELSGENVLVVTHACTVRGILNLLYENKEDFWQNGVPGNCSVNVIEIIRGTGKIIAEDKIYYDKDLRGDYYVLSK